MPNQDSNHDSDPEPAVPRNRAERRAQRRGKKPPAPPAGGGTTPSGHREQILVPRRSGRRGNR